MHLSWRGKFLSFIKCQLQGCVNKINKKSIPKPTPQKLYLDLYVKNHIFIDGNSINLYFRCFSFRNQLQRIRQFYISAIDLSFTNPCVLALQHFSRWRLEWITELGFRFSIIFLSQQRKSATSREEHAKKNLQNTEEV